jgi:hypothetical protein
MTDEGNRAILDQQRIDIGMGPVEDQQMFEPGMVNNIVKPTRYAPPVKDMPAHLPDRSASVYGVFLENATLSQSMKDPLTAHPRYDLLAPDQKEALTVILQKIARLVNGDCNHIDSWIDIEGYARLISARLQE